MIRTDDALSKIRKFYISHKRLPSYNEMRYLFNYKSKKASFDLAKRLISEGILEKDNMGRLLPKRLFLPPTLYGSIKAGYPAPSDEQQAQVLSFDSYLISKPDSTYLLKVSGDSMINAGLDSGDIVVVEKDKTAYDGDIVVAYIDNQWTLKYFRKVNGKVSLVPANPKYPTLYPKQSLAIGGVVVSSVRKYH